MAARPEARVTPHIQGALDADGRCRHWDAPADVVAFRFACCDSWWPCRDCHDEAAGHPASPWPTSLFHEPSVLCGACGTPLSVPAYRNAVDACPACTHAWNPACKPHWPLYFEDPGPQTDR